MKQRYWEIDALKGFAVILMILFHIVFDLYIFKNGSISPFEGIWVWVRQISVTIFITLVGVSTAIVASKYSGQKLYRKNLKRFIRVFFWALIISLASYIFEPGRMIHFGILHLIAISILISTAFAQFTWLNMIGAYLIWNYLPPLMGSGNTIIHIALGMPPATYQSYDYYPLVPWFSLVLLGIAIGNLLYRNKALRHPHSQTFKKIIFPFTLAGRYSLAVYILHQPIILLVLNFL